MKIDRKIRDSYTELMQLAIPLKEEVDLRFQSIDRRWHYESRLKSEESYALKVEAGRCDEELRIDDFFACTLVVQNAGQIGTAKELVSSTFSVAHTRPESLERTRRRPADFSFDDLRIYARTKEVDYLPPRIFSQMLFEIQVKTFLQHAWGVATHDLTYKSDTVSWARMRIAHEIRAMLEHAELSISRVEELSKSEIVAKQYDGYERLGSIIAMVRSRWSKERLPKDLRRLAESVDRVLLVVGVSIADAETALEIESGNGKGARLENLSPYSAIIQTIVNQFPDRLYSLGQPPRERVTVSSQVEIPPALSGRLDKRYFRVI